MLREILTRGGDESLVKEVLDSCLACKGCSSECPSNVDMTHLRAEVLQHYYDKHGTPLMRLGYQVEIPKHVESGRAAISKGCLKLAKKFAETNVSLLADKVTDAHPLVGIEPSCILSFRDEYPDLVAPENRDKAKALGRNCLLYDEFLLQEIQTGNISPDYFEKTEMEIWLHGHCHQKALVGVDKTAKVLQQLLTGAKVHVIPSGCCGMAGSFGYEQEHYETSLAIGEMILFPAVRKAVKSSDRVPAVVAAPGTSCRQQILDGTGVRAVHPIEILYRQCLRSVPR